MTLDPVIITAALALIGGMGTLLVAMYRAFMSGDLHPAKTVPRASFERLVTINESYAAKFDEQTRAVRAQVAINEAMLRQLDENSRLLKELTRRRAGKS